MDDASDGLLGPFNYINNRGRSTQRRGTFAIRGNANMRPHSVERRPYQRNSSEAGAMQHDGAPGWQRDRSASRPAGMPGWQRDRSQSRPAGMSGWQRDTSSSRSHGTPGRSSPILQSRRGNHHSSNMENNTLEGDSRGSNSNQRRNFPRKEFLGFRRLELIAKSAPKETLAKLMQCREAFIDLIQSPIERLDVFALTLEIIAKVCQSSFDETKSKMIIDICNSNFIVSFTSYLMQLPYAQCKLSNNLYWKDQEAFWKNFVCFCDCVVSTYPTLALNKCRSLLESTSQTCLEFLKVRHDFALPQERSDKLVELRERMTSFEKKYVENRSSNKNRSAPGAPPEDFRELSIMPTREDLLHKRPYIRPNIVDGGYQDVEHYLDVQFRLLREDCYGPLRDGLNQFLEDQQKKRYDNIRVFRDVKFVKPYVSPTKVGSLVQIDVKNNKMFKRTNWANNKRFIYGSLVLFTKDNCKSFITATILDREEEYLAHGLIPVLIIGQGFNIQLYSDESYTMIESEVYFEPYYHVLKVLQDPTFPQHISMKQYIVDVNPQPRPPLYLTEDTEFTVETIISNRVVSKSLEYDDFTEIISDIMDDENDGEVEFKVLKDETWPMKDALSFNDSQYDAYKLSLTHEFAVVQGPPGTGKTYLGIKVAKTLIENLKEKEGCLMLVICYTNHALDQFLEALLDVTESIVRIGGQSRNEAMNDINLTKLRRDVSLGSNSHRPFFDQKIALKECIAEFQKSLVELDVLLNGVVKCNVIAEEVDEVKYLRDFYMAGAEDINERYDVLFLWLFEHKDRTRSDVNYLLNSNAEDNAIANHEKENRKRTGVVLDDHDNNNAEYVAYRDRMASFSLDAANAHIKRLVAQYKNTSNDQLKRHIINELEMLDSYRKLFNEMAANRQRTIDIRVTANTNFNRFSAVDRWTLYFTWMHERTRIIRNKVGQLQVQVNTTTTMYEESRMMMDLQVLEGRRIVGMTTSGAARMRKLLQTLDPPIVIVEEAAEVLEQHIITSLTKGCQHLILIGDHQQLRPSASHMRLAKHFKLEVSLFERMINNGMHSRRLSVQHRMRPEIAALICPHIYPELENHPSVYHFPDVKGITKNLFFFSHEFKEEELQENMSRANHKEAEMTLGLANYLMQQGYDAEDVTILAAYKGQMFYMRKESDKYSHLKGVKITVVDNYQGEESKIILLSLVRYNDENKIGFLGTANRICVALSRAREGFYIFGNIETLKTNSELWTNIAATLESNGSVGTQLTLQCQNHTDNMAIVEKLEDFNKVPEGGCLLQCDTQLPKCGHKCLKLCHGYDRNHSTPATNCTLKCERIQCVLNHVCPKMCAEVCGPCLRKIVKKLPCGHDMSIFCHLEPEDPSIKCVTVVEVTLPDCKHKATKACHMDIKKIRCPVKCEFRVDKCGHSCLLNCHVKNDPDHEKYLCTKPCAKAKRNCSANLDGERGDHQCYKQCHELCDPCDVPVLKRRKECKHMSKVKCSTDLATIPCDAKCARSLPCGHFCKNKCKDPCGDCTEMVEKTIPDCKHVFKMMCKTEPTRKECKMPCERTLDCGHKCKKICSEQCNSSECNEPSTRQFPSPCGHLVSLPCNKADLPADRVEASWLVAACAATCGIELACGHMCAGTCALCKQSRLHVPCRQTCHQINICQHQCEEPCNQICPPCKKPCEVKCQHSRCSQMCGAPCKSCKEKCQRRCRHGVCKKRCGEVCHREACNKPCPRKLDCGHPCRGLCGEPCPHICKPCRPDTFPVDFLGDQFEDTDKFVLLEDCGHVMEVENMDNLMRGDSETVKIRCCPFCRKPIINTGRYKDLVNATFKNEINVIKTRVYGTNKSIADTTQKLRADLGSYRAKYEQQLLKNDLLKTVFVKLATVVKTQKKVSKLQLDMELICLNILDMITECYKSYVTNNATQLKNELATQIKLLCSIFVFQTKNGVIFKISEQQQNDVKLEIRRLNAIVQLARLMSHGAYAQVKDTATVLNASKAAHAAVFRPAVFQETETTAALKTLQEAIKASDMVVTVQQRQLIVKAIGLKAGHWYKCPKGHFYCIGECGGANQVGRCPERGCGAVIGGRSHSLASGNAHAPEMDGSSFAAWSDQYNNMANFNID